MQKKSCFSWSSCFAFVTFFVFSLSLFLLNPSRLLQVLLFCMFPLDVVNRNASSYSIASCRFYRPPSYWQGPKWSLCFTKVCFGPLEDTQAWQSSPFPQWKTSKWTSCHTLINSREAVCVQESFQTLSMSVLFPVSDMISSASRCLWRQAELGHCVSSFRRETIRSKIKEMCSTEKGQQETTAPKENRKHCESRKIENKGLKIHKTRLWFFIWKSTCILLMELYNMVLDREFKSY